MSSFFGTVPLAPAAADDDSGQDAIYDVQYSQVGRRSQAIDFGSLAGRDDDAASDEHARKRGPGKYDVRWEGVEGRKSVALLGVTGRDHGEKEEADNRKPLDVSRGERVTRRRLCALWCTRPASLPWEREKGGGSAPGQPG